MPDLTFAVRGAEPVRGAAAPAVALQLQISNRPPQETVQTVVLRCQAQIESPRRRYTSLEQQKLRDVFGEPERWGQTLKPLLWSNIAAVVPAFTGSATISLSLPCTFDFHVSATKYFHALTDESTVPLTLLFSGTVFYQSPGHGLQVAPISWTSEARFQLPVRVWKESIALHYGETAWLGLRRDVFERLYDFKVREGLATFEEALQLMLNAREEVTAL